MEGCVPPFVEIEFIIVLGCSPSFQLLSRSSFKVRTTRSANEITSTLVSRSLLLCATFVLLSTFGLLYARSYI